MSTHLYYLLARQRHAEAADRAERVRQIRDTRGLDASRRDLRLVDRVLTALRRGDAARTRVRPSGSGSGDVNPLAAAVGITLRLADAADGSAIADLAGLDSARSPAEPILIAEVDGELRAALSLRDGALIANPFHRTLVAQQLLRARAAQLRGDPVPRGSRPLLRRMGPAATSSRTDPAAALGGAGADPSPD
jgi:hypothetical protein